MYPVKGDCVDSIMAEFQIFLRDCLQIPDGEILREQVETVRRFRGTRFSRSRHEIMAIFSDAETRDFVLSHAKNLAGNANAGIRIDVPQHLIGIKRTFDEYGYILKGELGVGFKRNVRFDDTNETLVMDIYYPQDKKWDRISHSQAVDGVEFKKRSGFDRSNDEDQVQPQPMQIAQNQMPSTSQQTPAPILRASNLTTGNGRNTTPAPGVWSGTM